MRGVAIDLLGESVFVSAVIIGQLSLDVPRRCNGRRVLFYTNVAEVTLYFSRILDSPHDLHVFSAFGAGANIESKAMSSSKSPSKPSAYPSLAARKARAQAVIDRLKTQLPDPKTELLYDTPFQLLVSVVLSAQCTDKQVNKVMGPLQAAGFCPAQVLEWGAEGVLARIKSIGFAPTKSRHVFALTKILTEKFGGNVPRAREDLESLPGVGRKTANVILAEIYKEPQMAVDTHVFRVSARLGLQREKTADKAELELLKVIDPKELPGAHHLFILHGRYTCKALKPDCAACRVNDLCPSAFQIKTVRTAATRKKVTRR